MLSGPVCDFCDFAPARVRWERRRADRDASFVRAPAISGRVNAVVRERAFAMVTLGSFLERIGVCGWRSIGRPVLAGWVFAAAAVAHQPVLGGEASQPEVDVVGAGRPRRVSFRNEVVPLLTKLGCSQGACHGGQHGKGGFKLSLAGLRARRRLHRRSPRVPRNGGSHRSRPRKACSCSSRHWRWRTAAARRWTSIRPRTGC